jgi:hypothetical protein
VERRGLEAAAPRQGPSLCCCLQAARSAAHAPRRLPPTPRSPPLVPLSCTTQVIVYATPKNASKGLARLISESAAAAIKAKGSFTLVLSGGSVLSTLSGLVDSKIDWSKVWVFFVDERNVAHGSPDSNVGAATEALLGRVPVPKDQVGGARGGGGAAGRGGGLAAGAARGARQEGCCCRGTKTQRNVRNKPSSFTEPRGKVCIEHRPTKPGNQTQLQGPCSGSSRWAVRAPEQAPALTSLCLRAPSPHPPPGHRDQGGSDRAAGSHRV